MCPTKYFTPEPSLYDSVNYYDGCDGCTRQVKIINESYQNLDN